MQNKPLGLYLHVPFCARKCPYCDFYSVPPAGDTADLYGQALARAMRPYRQNGLAADTVYFGGGTPSLLGADRLSALLGAVRDNFAVAPDAEITCEANPGRLEADFFPRLRQGGFNRISLGMQSADEMELRYLGRPHSREDTAAAVLAAQHAGFSNISVDLMLGVPTGSPEKLSRTANFIQTLGVQHVSAYLLKIEEGTPFYAHRETLPLPDDDCMADLYAQAAEQLEDAGFAQYEISNFARPGFESRHNLKYWHCEEYLGFGPAAHSFFESRRFYYSRSLADFLAGKPPLPDGTGGDFEEFAMLNLRLREGVTRAACRARFSEGDSLFDRLRKNAAKCPPHLLRADENSVALTADGFLVSNAVIGLLLEP